MAYSTLWESNLSRCVLNSTVWVGMNGYVLVSWCLCAVLRIVSLPSSPDEI